MFRGKTKNGVDVKSTLGMRDHGTSPTWFVVADQSKVRIFESIGKRLNLVQAMQNPEGKAKASDLVSDQPGRSFDSQTKSHHGQTGAPRHSLSSRATPHEKVVDAFVAEVAGALCEARKQRRFGRLVLIANAHMLGQLQEKFDKTTLELIEQTQTHDFAWLDDNEVAERLGSRLNT